MSEKMILISRPATPDEAEVIERKGGLRLTNVMRESVIKKALDHAFSKRFAKLLEDEHKLSHLFMVKKFGSAKIEAALVLGEPWVLHNKDYNDSPREDGLAVNWRVGGQHVQVHHLDPIPRNCHHGAAKHFTITDEKLVAKSREWQEASEALRTESNKTQHTLAAMLQSITTFKSLETQWPEGKQFYKHLPKDFPYRHQVPATLVSELNKSLGI